MTLITSPILPGEVLAQKYRVERMLGQGGMGVVVSARHVELGHQVAIKFLVSDGPKNSTERFLREARAAALVKSEHVCRVFDVGRLDSGEPYIVMEYLEGWDLAEMLASDGPPPIETVARWIIEACDALASAHSQGVVHRDLKPANLFLQQGVDGATAIKVVDFGISKVASPDKLTRTAVMMGTPIYMSPEQLESARDVDFRSDIWSLGVVLYELLTGSPPFNGESLVQLAVQVREKPHPAPSSRRPEVPPALEQVVDKCLSKRAEDRYESVNHMVADLAPFAPPEATALVAKMTRRLALRGSNPHVPGERSPARATPEPIDALSKTTPSDAVHRRPLAENQADPPTDVAAAAPASGTTPPVTPSSKESEGEQDPLARTFDPVRTGSQRAQARALVLGAAGLVAVAATAFAVARRSPTTAPAVASASAPSILPVTPPRPPSTRESNPLAPPPQNVASAEVASARPPLPSAPSTTRPRISVHPPGTSTPPTANPSVSPTVTAAAAPIPASPSTSGKKPPSIDRDYGP